MLMLHLKPISRFEVIDSIKKKFFIIFISLAVRFDFRVNIRRHYFD